MISVKMKNVINESFNGLYKIEKYIMYNNHILYMMEQ